MVTLRRYWLLEGEVGRRSLSKRSQIGGVRRSASHGPARLLRHRAGHRSSTIESAFRLRETTFGTRGWFRPVSCRPAGRQRRGIYARSRPRRAVRRSLRSNRCSADLGAGIRAPNRPSAGIAVLWSSCIPSLDDAELLDESNRYRGAYQVAFESVRDYDTGRHNFHRWEAEMQQRIPGFTARTASDAARVSRLDQQRRRCAVLHAVHPGRQRRTQDIPARHARR